MKIHDVAQGTPAWMKLRAGIPTASCFDQIVTKTGELSKSSRGYLHHLLAERILHMPIDGFKSSAMEHGNEYEDRAIGGYELQTSWETYRVGFVTTDDGRIGCSPDRFIIGNDYGMVEAKAPTPKVHVGYLLAEAGASDEYKVQLQGQLWVCERDWVDIVSHCPGMPDAVFRVNRDEEFIGKLCAAVMAFSDRLESLTETFRERGWITDEAETEEPENPLGFTAEDAAWAMANLAGGLR